MSHEQFPYEQPSDDPQLSSEEKLRFSLISLNETARLVLQNTLNVGEITPEILARYEMMTSEGHRCDDLLCKRRPSDCNLREVYGIE